MSPDIISRRDLALLALVAIAVTAATAWSTGPFGPGGSPDAASYVATARSLAEGRGFTTFGPHSYTAWPPLYPLVLAAFARFGVELLDAARWLNAALSGIAVWIAGQMAFEALGRRTLAWCAIVALALSPAARFVGVFAWSEMLFTVLVLLALRSLMRHARDGARADLLRAGAWAACACLTRYAGGAMLAAGAWSIIAASARRERWRDAAYFVVIGTLPLCAWLVRCMLVEDYPLGDRYAAVVSVADVARGFASAIGRWILGWSVSEPSTSIARTALAALGIALACGVVALALGARTSITAPLCRFAAVYVVLVSALAATTGFDGWSGRMVAPLAPALVIAGAAALARWAGHSRARRYAMETCAALACVPIAVAGVQPLMRAREGRVPYNRRAFASLEIMHALRERPLEGLVFSNDPAALALFATRDSYTLPSELDSRGNGQARAAVERAPRDAAWWLVWVGAPLDPALENELARAQRRDLVARFADGALYRIR